MLRQYNVYSTYVHVAVMVNVKGVYFLESSVYLTQPLLSRSLCPSVVVQSMLKEGAIRDMLGTHMTDVTFALRVKIFPYPEHVCSVWLMLALKYSTPKTGRVSKQDL